MNSFWDFVDWILPPVRIVDDLTDYPSDHAHRSRSNHHHSSGTTRRVSGRDHDKERERESGRRREKDRDRERERERHGDRERERERERERTRERGRETPRRGPEQDREREQLRQRIQQLERENDSLQSQLRTTREELSTLSAAVFAPTSPSERTPPPHPFTYATSPATPDPALIALPPSRAHSRASSSEASTSRTPVGIAQYSAEAALADPRRLRVLYSALRATYGDARQTILAQAEELASLKSFLSKTDEWSGAQLLQALADLNSEIIQLSASVAEEFAASLRTDPRAPGVGAGSGAGTGKKRERDRQIVEPALGREMLELLEGREHAEDPTLVQFALQAWEVWCVSRVMDAFCYGLPAEVDEALKLLFERMQREEPQPTTARWRALTYKHARSLIARPRHSQSSEPASPDAPSPFNSAPASIVSTTSLPPPLLTLAEANLRGILAVLALAGCSDARGLHRDPLRALYGSALARISARAERISTVVKEGVLSGLFDVVWVPPCQSPRAATASSRPTSATPHVNGVGANRGKGTEAEWVKEVERAQLGDVDDKPQLGEPGERERRRGDRWFDWGAMENVYAGHCDEHCRVLCTVELGLAFARRVPAEEGGDGEESVDGDGMVVGSRPTSSASRPVSMGLNGETADEAAGDGGRLVRTLLLKPKVLLESVVDIL